MTFNSLQYLVFLPAVLVMYWRLGHRGQNRLLLVASYVFYGFFDWRFLGLLALSTVLDFWFGHALARASEGEGRKKWLWASVSVNLGILGVFKYFNFFFDSAHQLLAKVGLDVSEPALRVVLPIGISFYTFHGISYVFDVYRNRIEPTNHLVDYACFVAYFPQLVAGPIGRATIQLPQFEGERTRPDAARIESAVLLILLGLFKKVVIADGVAAAANVAFGNPSGSGSVTLLVGALAFSLEIYGDFSGYSDIARGSSRLLGIELPANFAQPYLSRNITEFWQRWHISLSTWLRDYLYVPLGGNRGSRLATYRNLFIVMLLGGLWHGASWTFVIWGAGHGLALAGHRAFSEERPSADVEEGLALGGRAGTFALVTLLWLLFRSASFSAAKDYLVGLLSFRTGPVDHNQLYLVAFAACAVLVIDLVTRRVHEDGASLLVRLGDFPVGIAVGAVLTAVIVFSGAPPTKFIYFQF